MNQRLSQRLNLRVARSSKSGKNKIKIYNNIKEDGRFQVFFSSLVPEGQMSLKAEHSTNWSESKLSTKETVVNPLTTLISRRQKKRSQKTQKNKKTS